MPYAANTWQVEMVYTHGPEQAVNVFHLQGHDALTSAVAETIRAYFVTFDASWKAHRASSSRLSAVRVRDVSTSGGVVWEESRSDAGTATAQTLPFQCTVVLSWPTAMSGRRYRGRTYLPYLTTAALGDSGAGWPAVQDPLRNAAAHGGDTLISSLSTATFPLVVASKAGTVNTPVTDCKCGIQWDTQRRRRSKLSESPYIT